MSKIVSLLWSYSFFKYYSISVLVSSVLTAIKSFLTLEMSMYSISYWGKGDIYKGSKKIIYIIKLMPSNDSAVQLKYNDYGSKSEF